MIDRFGTDIVFSDAWAALSLEKDRPDTIWRKADHMSELRQFRYFVDFPAPNSRKPSPADA